MGLLLPATVDCTCAGRPSCDHEDGVLAEAGLVHLPMRSLQLALPFLGDGAWPALDAVFPLMGAGHSVHATADMLAELERFPAACAASRAWCLVDTDRGARVSNQAYPEPIRRLTLWGNAGRAHLDRDSFVVMRGDDEVFRATAFTQSLIDAVTETYTLENTDTGATYTSAANYKAWLPGTPYETYVPEKLAVEHRPVDPAEYANTTDDLLAVVRASLDTGNPIVWLC